MILDEEDWNNLLEVMEENNNKSISKEEYQRIMKSCRNIIYDEHDKGPL